MSETMEFTHYKFEKHDGLPPDGEQGQFFGFNKEGWAFILRWVKPFAGDAGFWAAVGMEPVRRENPRRDFDLLSLHCGERADYIVSWATAPWAWAPPARPKEEIDAA